MRSESDPLSFVVCVCVCFLLFTHTLLSASQTPCPFSENTTCVTKAANLLSTAVSPVWGGKHFLSPSQSPLWSHSNPLSHHSTKINHYTLIGPPLGSALLSCVQRHGVNLLQVMVVHLNYKRK